MLTKDILKKEFSKKWRQNYEVEIFKEEGFSRKICKKCGKAFWTISNRDTCDTPGCTDYTFIGKRVTRETLNYIEVWKKFEKFFVKNNHTSIKRYPVVDRWRPDLYFTIASIQNFQRIDNGKLVMEYPADPLIVPQVCLRFNDIPNVGITGRHHTSFIMSGQHSFGKYWKDTCIELNFKFLTNVLGIRKEHITYVEDLWAMPDFSQFGPSLETFAYGLELVNSVFSQYTKTNSSYIELKQRVIDVGWGHERLVWICNSTPTGYDAVFGPVLDYMKRVVGINNDELFVKYSKIASNMGYEEANRIKVFEKLCKNIGIEKNEFEKKIRPLITIYAVADHIKTILFAVSDGMLPSNIGGGYNLRVLARRIFGFIQHLSIDIVKVAELHAKFLKPLFPELIENIDIFTKIIDIERKKYTTTIKNARILVEKELKKGSLNEEKMLMLYKSHGVTLEIVQEVAEKLGIQLNVNNTFYSKIVEEHMVEESRNLINVFDIDKYRRTELLFYNKKFEKRFKIKSRICGIVDNRYIILDKTIFYPESGGQDSDTGYINNCRVKKVIKVGDIILHEVDKINFKVGDIVVCVVDKERRIQNTVHHTATHLINAVCRIVLGKHVWQHSAYKCPEYGRIDITHYEMINNKKILEIERIANDFIKKDLKVDKFFLERGDAEKRYSFTIYQGGASPGKIIRIVKIGNIDVEACSGTHVDSLGEIGKIIITRVTKIQDGIIRLEYKARNAADKYMKELKERCKKIEKVLNARFRNHREELKRISEIFGVPVESIHTSITKMVKEVDINKIKTCDVVEKAKIVFEIWKKQRKKRERMARKEAKKLLNKFKNNYVYVVDLDRKTMIKIVEKKRNVILINKNNGYFVFKGDEDIFKKIIRIGAKGGGKLIKEGKIELKKVEDLRKIFTK